jgi:hypothetical protein
MRFWNVPLMAFALAVTGCSAKVAPEASGQDAGSGASTPDAGPGTSSTPAATAIVWNVDVGANDPSVCPVGPGDTWSIGSFSGSTLVTATNGSSFDGLLVTVSCQVSQSGGTYSVVANVQYGSEGALTLSGTITTASGNPSTWPAQTNISASFSDHGGLTENLSQSTGCTVTFSQNENMGISPTRIWGYIDCPHVTSQDGKTCDGNAEFLFENCSQ